MALDLDEEHKQYILLLLEQSSQVLEDFCKWAVDYLHTGPNWKLHSAAAQKLEIPPILVKRCIEVLLFLLIEARKRTWDESRFLELLRSLGFDEEKSAPLRKLYVAKSARIDAALTEIDLSFARYRDLEWRFEALLASRGMPERTTPMLTLDLSLNDVKNEVKHVLLQCDPINLVRLTQELESAIGEAHTGHMRIVKRSVK